MGLPFVALMCRNAKSSQWIILPGKMYSARKLLKQIAKLKVLACWCWEMQDRKSKTNRGLLRYRLWQYAFWFLTAFISSDRSSYSDSFLVEIRHQLFEILSISANIFSFSFWEFDNNWPCTSFSLSISLSFSLLFTHFSRLLYMISSLGFILSECTSGVSPVIF